jgi:hypothetical protein
MLVKGSYYTGTDDGAVNLIKMDDGRWCFFLGLFFVHLIWCHAASSGTAK